MTVALEKHGEVCRLLGLAWEAYVRAFPSGRHYEAVLAHITEAQRLVLAEDAQPQDAAGPARAS